MKNFTNLFDLTGKVAVITGASGLLGEYFAWGLASHGCNIALIDINPEKAADLAFSIRKRYSIKAQSYSCNIADANSVQQAIEKVISDFTQIDILINNAASKTNNLVKFGKRFEEYELSTWKEVSATNIEGMFLVSQSVGRHMLEKGIKGSIIQISSIYGILAPDQRIYENSKLNGSPIESPAVYSATKSAVIGLTKYLATYWASDGIRVNSLTPGGIFSGQNETFLKNYSNRVPMGRMADPNEIVGGIIYLASDASTYVTGANLVIDGGLTAW